jgi:phosphoenolpyruvate-protein kinase (PTS system EI component)
VFDSHRAAEEAAKGEKVILVRRETNPDDLVGMIAAQGILTSRGGKTSHAAVVARGMGKTCVCGAEELEVDLRGRKFTAPGGIKDVEATWPNPAPSETFRDRLEVHYRWNRGQIQVLEALLPARGWRIRLEAD